MQHYEKQLAHFSSIILNQPQQYECASPWTAYVRETLSHQAKPQLQPFVTHHHLPEVAVEIIIKREMLHHNCFRRHIVHLIASIVPRYLPEKKWKRKPSPFFPFLQCYLHERCSHYYSFIRASCRFNALMLVWAIWINFQARSHSNCLGSCCKTGLQLRTIICVLLIVHFTV